MAVRNLTRIGKYEVECVIGEGSMGVVYRAIDPLINRRVAIKVMTDAVAQDATLRGRFLREAQTAGSLQHPNVVTIYDFGEVDDHLFIAMEYVEGNDLSDILQQNVSLPIPDSLDLIIGVLHGLAYAHKRGVIHRDIKPANIRVDTEGKARLMDFGVAHLASSDMTSTGMLLGTPAYMAPEQITGGSVTAETDIFSVGAVLYELLAGRRPFVGDTLQALMYSILNRSPESLEAIVPKMPPGLHEVVMRALKKESGERYHSAMAMANDLAAIRDSLDPEGKRTSLSLRATIDSALAHETRALNRRKRERQAAMLAAAVLLAVGGFVAGRIWLSRTAAAPPLPMAVTSNADIAPSVTSRDSMSRAAVSTPIPTPPPAPLNPATTPPSKASVPGLPSIAARDVRHAEKRTNAALATIGAAGSLDTPAVVSPTPPRVAAPSPAERAPVVTQQQSSTAVPVPVPAASAVTPPRENVSEEIANVVAAYARALESLDLNELRRVYPSMTSQQRAAFEDFFRSIRTLKASLSVGGLQVDGSAAEAQVSGSFDYVTTSGSSERRNVNFVATVRREHGVWTLAGVH